MGTDSYSQGPRNTVKRSRDRAAYDFETVHSIIDKAPIVHVSFTPTADEPFPTILPMIGYLGSFSDQDAPLSSGGKDLYLHGHAASRLLKLPDNAKSDVITEEGLPVCVAATHVDGIVVSLTPFHNSMNYRSAVIHGYATVVRNEDERLWAMEKITDGVIPGRWAGSRYPNKAELQSTGMLKVQIVSASAKIRNGEPSEDKKDEEDESVRGKYWTGVVPVYTTYGHPVAAAANRVAVPGYIDKWVKETSSENEVAAQVAVDPSKQAEIRSSKKGLLGYIFS